MVDRSLVVCENFVTRKGPSTHVIDAKSFVFKCETPRLKLKSSRTFLAIKRCERTKTGKVIKQSRSSKLRWAHICAHSRIPVKDTTWWLRKTRNFPEKILFNEHASNTAHVDHNLSLWSYIGKSIRFTTQQQRHFPKRLKRNATIRVRAGTKNSRPVGFLL